MLAFLRKIRQSLIDSGATRRYLLYAVGEILLVMIGILLALQVNEWNQTRTNRQLEKNYLRNFLLDLKTDSLVIEQNKKILREEKMPGLRMINRLLHSDTPCCKDSVKWAIANSAFLGWALSQERSTATRDEIISSGNLRLISNEELRVALIRYYTYWEHALDRTNQRKSGYPNFTYELFDPDAPQDDAEWFYQTLR